MAVVSRSNSFYSCCSIAPYLNYSCSVGKHICEHLKVENSGKYSLQNKNQLVVQYCLVDRTKRNWIKIAIEKIQAQHRENLTVRH